MSINNIIYHCMMVSCLFFFIVSSICSLSSMINLGNKNLGSFFGGSSSFKISASRSFSGLLNLDDPSFPYKSQLIYIINFTFNLTIIWRKCESSKNWRFKSCLPFSLPPKRKNRNNVMCLHCKYWRLFGRNQGLYT